MDETLHHCLEENKWGRYYSQLEKHLVVLSDVWHLGTKKVYHVGITVYLTS